MDPMKKPEWFQLAESDVQKPRSKGKNSLRVLALSIPLIAIGIGVVVAQASDESPAVAETTSIAATQSPLASTSPVAQPAIAKPSIAKPPVGGGEENDDFRDDD
jgi:hypothetical protein